MKYTFWFIKPKFLIISDEDRLKGNGLTITFDRIDAKYKVRKVRLLSTHKDIISFVYPYTI